VQRKNPAKIDITKNRPAMVAIAQPKWLKTGGLDPRLAPLFHRRILATDA